jgi:hypothetical protein
VFDGVGEEGELVVPDTTSLVEQPDPGRYRPIAGRDDFTFVLLPPVLGELDKLKIAHKSPDVRKCAKSAITRIKGWRDRHDAPEVRSTMARSSTVQSGSSHSMWSPT